MYTGLEIGRVASQNSNHFWGKCESLWQSESQYCESLLADLRINFQMVLQKKNFLALTTFLDKISFFQAHFMYVIRNCESLCQSVSQNTNHFLFLKTSPVCKKV